MAMAASVAPAPAAAAASSEPAPPAREPAFPRFPSIRASSESLLPYKSGDLSENYSLTDVVVGQGQFGVIRQVIHKKTGAVLACKTVSKHKLETDEHFESLQTEISVMEYVQGHPNIVDRSAVYETDDSVHIIMELCKGGDLFHLLIKNKRFNEAQASWIFRKVVNAVAFCHSKGLLHRDLKPENILLSVGDNGVIQPKLADFGLTVALAPGHKAKGFAGSPFYMAPEAVLGKPYDTSADIWSLGVLLFTMLSGNLPFKEKTSLLTLAAVGTGKPDYNRHPWQLISVQAKKLVFRMLSMDPRHRPTTAELQSHPWVQGKFEKAGSNA